MSKYNFSEEEMRSHFISSHQAAGRELRTEVPVFCRSVDLVVYNRRKKEITAIEFKLSNWRRAIIQALQVTCCFDFLEICIPLPATQKGKDSVISECNNYGIGVVFYNSAKGTFEEPLKPKHISKIWEVQKNRVLEYLGGVCNE